MKYFAKVEDGKAMIVARLRRGGDVNFHERWSWRERQWVDGTEVFREMSGVGGDGYDWVEVPEDIAHQAIMLRYLMYPPVNPGGKEDQ